MRVYKRHGKWQVEVQDAQRVPAGVPGARVAIVSYHDTEGLRGRAGDGLAHRTGPTGQPH